MGTLAYSGILWHTLAYSSILWHTLAYSGILWHTLAYFGILWQTLANSGKLWQTLANFFRSHRSSTLDFHFLSHYSYIKAMMLYKGKTWQDSGILWHTLAH